MLSSSGLRPENEFGMNHDIDSTERFVAQLRELKPAVAGSGLQLRLEAALRETQIDTPRDRKIIYHPFFQWSAAAAALVTAMVLSIESTEHRASPQLTQAAPESPAQPNIHRVFQVVDGKLVPSAGRSAMMQTSYRGIQVIEGKAYRRFGQGQQNFLELIETVPQD